MRTFKCKYRNFMLVVKIDGKHHSVVFEDGVARVNDEKIAEAIINSLPYKRGEIFEWGKVENRIREMVDHSNRQNIKVTQYAISSRDLEPYIGEEVKEQAEKIVDIVKKEVKKGRKRRKK